MKLFDGINEIFDNLFSVTGEGWIIRESESIETIESCNGVATVDYSTNTCALCVALNKTIMKNNLKPNYYHINCKCVNKETTLTDVQLDFAMSKITNYLFTNTSKVGLMESMGYSLADSYDVYEQIAQNAKDKYMLGDYTLGILNIYGQKINITIVLAGKNDKLGQQYKFETGWTVYPNGKLHNNTPFAGWSE